MPRRTHPTQLVGLREALAAQEEDLMGRYRYLHPEEHDRHVAHILNGGVLHLHRYELADLVPLPAGSPEDNFVLTAEDELNDQRSATNSQRPTPTRPMVSRQRGWGTTTKINPRRTVP